MAQRLRALGALVRFLTGMAMVPYAIVQFPVPVKGGARLFVTLVQDVLMSSLDLHAWSIYTYLQAKH